MADVAEPGWGERDAGTWRARLRPLSRWARDVTARVQAARRLAHVTVPRGDVRLSFGFAEPPDPSRITIGGKVKVLALAKRFPNSGNAMNVLYLVTSALPDGAVALARAAKKKGVAVVVNQNGVAYPGWYGPEYDIVNQPMAELLRLADHVFYQSEFCRVAADRFLQVHPAQSEVLYNPVDTHAFTPADRRPQVFTLLLAGYQAKSYRVQTALDVLHRVASRISDAQLMITGRLGWAATDARGREMVAEWARALGIEDRVTMTGEYAQAAAPDIYRRANVLLHTKYNDPCPTVVLEALACGLPVVYSATGGVPELVGNDAGIGVPGELRWDRDVPPDAEALASAVLEIHRNELRYSAAARSRAVALFDVRDWLERHQATFERLVA